MIGTGRGPHMISAVLLDRARGLLCRKWTKKQQKIPIVTESRKSKGRWFKVSEKIELTWRSRHRSYHRRAFGVKFQPETLLSWWERRNRNFLVSSPRHSMCSARASPAPPSSPFSVEGNGGGSSYLVPLLSPARCIERRHFGWGGGGGGHWRKKNKVVRPEPCCHCLWLEVGWLPLLPYLSDCTWSWREMPRWRHVLGEQPKIKDN